MPEEKNNEEIPEMLPPLEFSSIFLPFSTQALIKLGILKDPISNKEEENLELAKRLIDLLDLLKEKTRGNLEQEEEKLLDLALHQLKAVYLEKSDLIKT
jgi:hypothetical protein